MSDLDSKLPPAHLNFANAKNTAKLNKGPASDQNKLNPENNLLDQNAKNVQQAQLNQSQSLVNTNSNIPLNQSTLVNPVVNQAAINLSNSPVKKAINLQSEPTSINTAFQGASDLPPYAGISNISFKSWISAQDNKSFANLSYNDELLTTTLEGIKGFQKENYEDSEEGSSRNNKGNKQGTKNKYFSILMHVFSNIEQSSSWEIEVLSKIINFKKLGSFKKDKDSEGSEQDEENKLLPPLPLELHKSDLIKNVKVKYLHQLLTLPSEFPECLRLFAKSKNEINAHELRTFLEQRLKLAQEQIFGTNLFLSETISKFAPLLNQNDFPVLLPLVLLYYPLPLPEIKKNSNLFDEWEKNRKDNKDEDENIIASCEVYYLSKNLGRFLLRFKLNNKDEFSSDIQTSNENIAVIEKLKQAIGESMFLLENPPLLSDLNVLLTNEIYKATDVDEELSIVSSGPLKLEIVLALYASLLVLNKLNIEPDPRGTIDMNNEIDND